MSLLDGPPRLLRPGAITRSQIEALIGPLAEAEADASMRTMFWTSPAFSSSVRRCQSKGMRGEAVSLPLAVIQSMW